MHTYLSRVDEALRTGTLKELLKTPINPIDFNSGLVAALIYTREAHLGCNGTAFDADNPTPESVQHATEHFARRVRGVTLYDQLIDSQRVLRNVPRCDAPRPTVLVGVIAVNHPDNLDERLRLYGTRPEQASSELAVKLDTKLNRLKARIGTAYVDGRELHPLEYVVVHTANGTH